jgi:hypothetical protein
MESTLSRDYILGYDRAFVSQQIKIAKLIKKVEDYLQKYDADYDFLLELYKIAGEE